MLIHAAAAARDVSHPQTGNARDNDTDDTFYLRRLVYCPGNAVLSVRPDHLNEPWTPPVSVSWAIAASAGEPAAGSRFESMAQRANKVPAKAGDLLSVLLASALPVPSRGCKVLRPLWVEEAMHRAYSFVRLVDIRNGYGAFTGENPHLDDAIAWEDAIACDLGARFRELAAGREREVLPCAAILQDVVAGFCALFGSPADVTVETRIDDVWLPGYQRRALVLATFELVSNALLHAFRGHAGGQIEVHLAANGAKSACLRVADNGVGFADASPNLDRGVAAGLAGLLEADLIYDRTAGWTVAEIAFPLSAPSDLGSDVSEVAGKSESARDDATWRSNVRYLR